MRPMPSKVPYRFVEVIWQDAEADPRWADKAEIVDGNSEAKKAPNGSRGWLLHQDNDWIVLASTYAWNGDWSWTNIMRIPAAMKLKITSL